MPVSKKTKTAKLPLATQMVERRIYMIRGQKVMLDSDLAELYRVTTKRLNEQIRRNNTRFPFDFMFRLTAAEAENLRSQIATSSWGGRRYLPLVFTEHGVAMLSSVLGSERAVKMSILIIRAFVKLREFLATHKDLAIRLERIENNQSQHASVINVLAEEIEDLKALPLPTPKRRIGFQTPSDYAEARHGAKRMSAAAGVNSGSPRTRSSLAERRP
jgi:hypothetical protein